MDAKRLEEFRSKLAEGRAVQVRGGQIGFAGDPAAPAGKAVSRSRAPAFAVAPEPGPEPGPEIEMKPHEWGAGGEAAAGQPFYFDAAGEARALAEQVLLAEHYPGFVLDVDSDGMPYVYGQLGPNRHLDRGYRLLVELPPGYGRGVMPRVYLLQPPLVAGAPHVYDDGSLCLDHTRAFTRRSTLLTLLAWVSVWLVLYEGWLDTGKRW